ncbi:hypothetical protein BT96DRAFT_970035 [Gymnopus androsaceus JB14]|uniref:Uncharacterized protein n=1 Tax=Gymnopus androsaceus JB14 TaxID=1447944 RepID=A0A6A4ILI0_9AGAR|nr:hypothetical protein BT96DRAFT_970035 [Gymnopus androsaceus JB14]
MNRKNKHGRGPSKDQLSTAGRAPSRDPSTTPSASSSPIPGGSGMAMGGGQSHGGFNGTVPKYIYDFSKALAGEVRVLLAEVGQLRDERSRLQYEIAEIMALKSKHAGGSPGEYGGMPGGMNFDHPDALAYAMAGLALPAPPGSSDPNLALAPVDQVPAPAPPAWRTVNKRAERKPRAPKKGVPQAIPTPSQVPPLEVPRPNVPAWSQWRPNPLLSPTPQHGQGHFGAGPGPGTPPPRVGLFGPPSPPPK